MADASYLQSSFLGGEVSVFYQGRYDKQDYRTYMAACLNGFPTETGAWVRAPGLQFAGTTRSGNPGRVIKWDFAQATAYQLEFTNGFLRFWQGPQIQFNNSLLISSITTDNPAKVNTILAHLMATGNQIMFSGLGAALPLLQNRRFTITVLGSTQFTIADAISGTTIDGSTLGVTGLPSTAGINRVLELTTPYSNGTWSSLRVVQAETKAVLLQGSIPPYILQSTAAPLQFFGAGFTLTQAVLNDGPYLDPPTNGALVTPGSKSGIVTLTLGFPSYSATQAYAAGAFVTSSSVNYESLVDQNVNNTPASSPSAWQAVSAGVAINGGRGFLGTDIGRLVRLYSEPAAWLAGSTYAKGATVSYNPSGIPGATTYWNALVGSNTGNVPGTDLVNWGILAQGGTSSPALWTWGKIVSLANFVSGSTGTNVGSMTGNGGLSAAFNGTTNQNAVSSAALVQNLPTIDGYVGKNYTGVSGKQIDHVTVYPASDQGFAAGTTETGRGGITTIVAGLTINLRGKASAPSSASDGTILGTSGASNFSAVTVTSSDQATSWNYVWVEIIANFVDSISGLPEAGPNNSIFAAQVQFFNPPGTGSGAAINVEILGPPLLYTTPIINWRLGAYSNTTGWPTCGCYYDGRLWLSGAIDNRFDTSVSNAVSGISGVNINFAPTDQYGNVLASSGISGVFNADSVNPVFWMIPDQQGVIMGTQAGEWMVFAPTSGSIAPTNIAVRSMTRVGSANVEPRHTEHTKVFVQRYGRKLIEYFSDVFSGKFTAPNLAEKAMHLTANGIAELAYQQAVTPIIWVRDLVGNLRGLVYKRDTLMTSQGPTFIGWFRRTLGSGRSVQSISAGPSVGGNLDSLAMTTFDPVSGVWHVEFMTDMMMEGAPLSAATYLDNFVAPSSAAQVSAGVLPPYGGLQLNGLWHLNGQTVQAWLGGLDCGLQEGGIAKGVYSDFTVSNGSITIPYGDGISAGSGAGLFTAAYVASFAGNMPLAVGFTFTSQGQLVRPNAPQESGARSGPAFGKKRRSHYWIGQFEGSNGVSFGTTFGATLQPALFKSPGNVNLLNNQQFTGIFRDNLKSDYTFDNQLCWQVTRPYICNVMAVGAALQTQDI